MIHYCVTMVATAVVSMWSEGELTGAVRVLTQEYGGVVVLMGWM